MFLSAWSVGLLVLAIFGRETSGGAWNYADAEDWADDFPNCGGMRQSPVNINRFQTKPCLFSNIEFRNYDVLPDSQTVTNNGHSVVVSIGSISDTPYIEWTVFLFSKVKYNFAQYHFHWGSVDGQGSEHTVDTVSYPMEVHLVHFNDKYPDITTAVSKSDGLAVLGIFFVISPNDNPALAPLIAAMQEVDDYTADPKFVDKTTLFALASLLPSNTKRFYRYDGSLTTPTCDESVLWTVFEEPIEVSAAQMAVFRTIVGTDGVSTSDNYRPVQDLNGRKVQRSWF